LGVVAEGFVKGRALTDAAIDEIPALRMILRKQIGLLGGAHRCGGLWELTKHGLTAKHDDFVIVGDGGCRADEMLERAPVHASRNARCLTSFQMRHLSRGGTTPANGVT
jgi:hypothetical protein